MSGSAPISPAARAHRSSTIAAWRSPRRACSRTASMPRLPPERRGTAGFSHRLEDGVPSRHRGRGKGAGPPGRPFRAGMPFRRDRRRRAGRREHHQALRRRSRGRAAENHLHRVAGEHRGCLGGGPARRRSGSVESGNPRHDDEAVDAAEAPYPAAERGILVVLDAEVAAERNRWKERDIGKRRLVARRTRPRPRALAAVMWSSMMRKAFRADFFTAASSAGKPSMSWRRAVVAADSSLAAKKSHIITCPNIFSSPGSQRPLWS